MKLPLNCEVEYIEDFLSEESANKLFSELMSIVVKQNFRPSTEEGKTYPVNFGKVMFLDKNLIDENRFPEKQWGASNAWTDKLKLVKEQIEKLTNQQFQVCVLIYYPDGNSGVGYHSDYPAFGDTSIIPSLSVGEEREFKFRNKESGDEFCQVLSNGSLTIMGDHCQERYEHSLPINSEYKRPRMNLTFRKYGFNDSK
jgi:alkylated DNA repair dioxygenase AlkB